MQNTIVKRFANDPRVAMAVLDQGGRYGETLDRFLLYWSSYFLRGTALFDADGAVGGGLLGQPRTGLPFGRGFVIAPDGTVALPYFGYDPARIIAAIEAQLPVPPPRRPVARAAAGARSAAVPAGEDTESRASASPSARRAR